AWRRRSVEEGGVDPGRAAYWRTRLVVLEYSRSRRGGVDRRHRPPSAQAAGRLRRGRRAEDSPRDLRPHGSTGGYARFRKSISISRWSSVVIVFGACNS